MENVKFRKTPFNPGGVVAHPLILTLGRQRQVDLCECEASLVYRESSRTGSKATEKPCLKKTNKQKKQTNKQKGTLYSL